MNKNLRHNDQGITHVLTAALIVIVIAVIGVVGWRVTSSNSSKSKNSSTTPAASKSSVATVSAAKSSCLSSYHDSDLCAFVAAEAATPFSKTASKITITGTSGGSDSNITLLQDGKGNVSFSISGGGQTISTVVYNNQTYTQQTTGGPWVTYGSNGSTNTSTSSIPDNALSSFLSSVSTTAYTKIGTEACGSLTCFKYQVKDSTTPTTTQYVWFDTKDHLLRQFYNSDSSTGDKLTMAVDYQSVSIPKPSPVQNLSSPTNQ